ncbi:MAG: hypothetical protein M0R30_10080 [Methanoregula sp.]|jgi:hypothetical protein|uniref:hypothetical protein n=1 Tax=Methanoregula sp. TaxID=2052170 RepID=UPI0026014855|nr:hypothetical protein [Methanoregula sp.]MCK9631978.1 hypothetical protein [Methanoregula sp.]
MTSWKRPGIFILLALLLVIVPAEAAMAGNNTTVSSGSSDIRGSPVQTPYWITVDTLPIGTHSTGDSFIVSGKTSFPSGYEVEFGAYQSQYLPGSPDLLPPVYSGSSLVADGLNGENEWSFFVNTTQFRKTLKNGTTIQSAALAGEYTLSIGPSGMVMYPFTLVEKNVSPATVPVPVSSDHLDNPPMFPRTTSASIPVTIPVTALIIGISLLLRKQE